MNSGSMNNDGVLVIDTLSVWSLAAAVRRFSSVRAVRYLHIGSGPFTAVLISALALSGWRFEPVRLTLCAESGNYPFKDLQRALFGTTGHVRENIFRHYMNSLTNVSSYERERLAMCLTKYAGAAMYHTMQLLVLLRKKTIFDGRVISVLIRGAVFNDVIADAYKKAGFQACFYAAPAGLKFKPREGFYRDSLVLGLRKLGYRRTARTLLLVIFSFYCKLRALFTARAGKYDICAFLAGSNANDMVNNAPWMTEGKDRLHTGVLGLYQRSLPEEACAFYGKRCAAIMEYGFNPFSGNRDIELVGVWSRFVNEFVKNIRLYRPLFGVTGLRRWMTGCLIDVMTYLSFFEPLFRLTGAKVIWTSDLDDSQTQMAAMAINRLGGVSTGSTLSHGLMPEWDLQLNKNDVYFAWGQRFTRIRLKSFDQCDSLVIVGYPMDKVFSGEFEKGGQYRSMIREKYKADRVLTFYDTGSGPEHMVSTDQALAMYRAIFKWLDSGSSNFAVIKSKGMRAMNRYPFVKDEIESFVQKGKMDIVLEHSVFHPGLAADLVLSASPTPASIIAVLGHPIIFFNTQDVEKDYSIELPNVRVIKNTDELSAAIEGEFER
ncbi:MAG: hypothetical protein ABH885_06955 [Candidatus Omnitrophota bacterium]